MLKKSLLFYNLYPKNRWKGITKSLLSNIPHDDIIVHITLTPWTRIQLKLIQKELKKYPKIKQIIYSFNDKKLGEVRGFQKLKEEIDLKDYQLLTYIHSKGSSKKRKDTQATRDWTEMMRYFVVENLRKAQEVFAKGYYLYGVNLTTHIYSNDTEKLNQPKTNFIYPGNFITINLDALRESFLQTQCHLDYYGVERFWGRLCSLEKAYSAYESHIVNHYENVHPAHLYKPTSENTTNPDSNAPE